MGVPPGEFTTTIAGDYRVAVQLDGHVVGGGGRDVLVTVAPGALSVPHSSVLGPAVSGALVAAPATLIVTPRDVYSNVVALPVAVTLSPPLPVALQRLPDGSTTVEVRACTALPYASCARLCVSAYSEFACSALPLTRFVGWGTMQFVALVPGEVTATVVVGGGTINVVAITVAPLPAPTVLHALLGADGVTVTIALSHPVDAGVLSESVDCGVVLQADTVALLGVEPACSLLALDPAEGAGMLVRLPALLTLSLFLNPAV